jgi:hypothetical protein
LKGLSGIEKSLQVQLTPVRLDPCRKSGKKGSQSKTLTRDSATGEHAPYFWTVLSSGAFFHAD